VGARHPRCPAMMPMTVHKGVDLETGANNSSVESASEANATY
jgi:hypothetical protein